MKKTTLLSFGQKVNDKINIFGEYHKDWALVYKDGLVGFINKEGEEVVKPSFDMIEKGDVIKGQIDGEMEIIKH